MYITLDESNTEYPESEDDSFPAITVTTEKQSNGRFRIRHDYSARLNRVVKRFPKYYWDVIEKYWTLPLVSYDKFCELLYRKKFNHMALPDVGQLDLADNIWPTTVTLVYDPEYKCKNFKKLYQIKLKELYGITHRDKRRNITVLRINSYVQDFAKLMKAFKVYDRECHYDLEYRVVIFFENIIPMSDRYHTYLHNQYKNLKNLLEHNNVKCIETKILTTDQNNYDYIKNSTDPIEQVQEESYIHSDNETVEDFHQRLKIDFENKKSKSERQNKGIETLEELEEQILMQKNKSFVTEDLDLKFESKNRISGDLKRKSRSPERIEKKKIKTEYK